MYVTLSVRIFLGCCIFKKHITYREKGAIIFVIAFSVLNLIYLTIGDALGGTNFMEKHISFFVVLGVSGFIAWYITNRKVYEKSAY